AYSLGLAGGTIYFPPGIYAISQTLNIYNGVSLNDALNSTTSTYNSMSNGPATHIQLLGQSKDNVILKETTEEPLFETVKEGVTPALYRISCENIRFWGTGVGTSFDLYSATAL